VRWFALLLLGALLLAGCPRPEPSPSGDAGEQEVALAILSFTASPDSVAAGQTVTLAWETSGASACEIEPAPGVVPRVGSAQVSPAVSTSYTLRCTRGDEEVREGIFVQVTGGIDGGPTDGGPVDGGAVDGGSSDAGYDAGPQDAGPAVTGLVGARLEPMPADLLSITDDEDLLVYPEQEGFVLPTDLPCGVHVAADYDDDTYVRGGVIPAGTRVDSFFVRAASTTKDVFQADVTFNREVLCVMPTDGSMDASQPVLAKDGTTYPSLNPDGGSNNASGVDVGSPDRLALSDDRRTVRFSYVTPLDSLERDDTRIVVAATGQGPVEIHSPSAVRATATSLVEESLAQSDVVFVVDETSGVTLDAPLAVDVLAPGAVNGAGTDGGPAMLPAGTYDTVILHMDPAGNVLNGGYATVTFDRRVVGAAIFADTFGAGTTAISSPLTFAASTAWESDTDVLVLFGDERSVYVQVATSDGRVDDARLYLEPAE
jgi:hypothetical protein